MGDQEAAPLLLVEALDEGEHLGPVLLEAGEEVGLGHAPEGERPLVDVAAHVADAERVGTGPAGLGDVDAR